MVSVDIVRLDHTVHLQSGQSDIYIATGTSGLVDCIGVAIVRSHMILVDSILRASRVRPTFGRVSYQNEFPPLVDGLHILFVNSIGLFNNERPQFLVGDVLTFGWV